MTLPGKLLIAATAGAAAILSVLSMPASAFRLVHPEGEAYDLIDPLGDLPPNAFGTVRLNPAVVGYLPRPAAGAKILTQFGADAATQFPNWTAVSGAALGGILTINEYDARDYAAEPGPPFPAPRGGADMEATYTRAATDPPIADLRFIQLFTRNTGPNGTLESHIDPFPNEEGDNLPWYWTEAEHEENSTATTMTFRDQSSAAFTMIPFNRTVRFEAYLATFDSEKKEATIHDGWSWGYDVEANARGAPEPATILGSVMALGCGAFFKRKVSRKCKR